VHGNVLSKRFDGVYDGELRFYKLATMNLFHQSIFFRKIVFKKIGIFNLRYILQSD
jgi:hypothetical protein